jgi:hypothetical protein
VLRRRQDLLLLRGVGAQGGIHAIGCAAGAAKAGHRLHDLGRGVRSRELRARVAQVVKAWPDDSLLKVNLTGQVVAPPTWLRLG